MRGEGRPHERGTAGQCGQRDDKEIGGAEGEGEEAGQRRTDNMARAGRLGCGVEGRSERERNKHAGCTGIKVDTMNWMIPTDGTSKRMSKPLARRKKVVKAMCFAARIGRWRQQEAVLTLIQH
eukprot:4799922-Pleurochrysis_carterae.AAC.6